MQGFLHWLTSLPLPLLYAILAVAAAVENFFPPAPADTVVAVGSALAARGQGSIAIVVACTWLGNLSGAMIMYGVGRHFGADWLRRRLPGRHLADAPERLRASYAHYGLGAIFVSRFIPAVRAVVPPFAGALRTPVLATALMMGAASAIWYGLVSWIGFSVGDNLDVLTRMITHYGTVAAIIAIAILILGGATWWWQRLRQQHERP